MNCSYANLKDEDLLRLYVDRGEEAAFKELQRRWDPRLLKHFRTRWGGVKGQEPEDFLQQTWLKILQKAPLFDLDTRPFDAWVWSWVRGEGSHGNVSDRRHRDNETSPTPPPAPDGEEGSAHEPQAGPAADPVEAAAAGALEAVLDQAFARLSHNQREALWLSEMDFKDREVAVIMDTSEGNVKSLKSLGRDRLEEYLRTHRWDLREVGLDRPGQRPLPPAVPGRVNGRKTDHEQAV